MHMGKSYQVSAKVDEGMLASALGSGDVGVLATPVMLSLMEQAACACVQDCLKEGETTVGAQIDLAHISAVPEMCIRDRGEGVHPAVAIPWDV